MSELTVWAGATGLDAAALRPGRDLVLVLGIGDGLRVPDGCAVDDHLDAAARAAVDADAERRYRQWRGDGHVVGGLDLSWVWEVEMKARLFQPLARLAAAARALGSPPLALRGFAPALAEAVVGELPARAEPGDAGLPPVIPRGREHPLVEGAARVLRAVGVPPRVRGDVVGMHYWHLAPLYARIPVVPVGPLLREQPLRRTLGTAVRRGWTGLPRAGAGAPLPGLIGELAGPSVAEHAHLRRAFRRRPPKLAILPFDSPETARVLLAAAHEAGATSLVVQHGMENLLGHPDKRAAEHVAVWSSHDRDLLAGEAAGELHVTGNPGVAHLLEPPPARAAGGPVVVLVEYTSRLSSLVPTRIPLLHTRAALEGIEAARPGSAVVVRPHPSDHEQAAYERLASEHPRLDVRIDRTTAIEPLLAGASACVGALSTATLQAAALGVPTVFLDLTAARRPWPFDGAAGALERAVSAEALAAALADLPARREVGLEALGARPEALDALTELVADLV